MTDWQPPERWSPEEVEHWKSLDHSHCTQMGWNPDYPQFGYAYCQSIHCHQCGRSTSSQGHLTPAEPGNWKGKLVCPTPPADRKLWPGVGPE